MTKKDKEKEAKVVQMNPDNKVDNTANETELTDEQKEFARMTVRNEFNKEFSKWAEIDPVNATDDDIAQVKKEFEDCVEENKNKLYTIALHQDGLALKTAEFLFGICKRYG